MRDHPALRAALDGHEQVVPVFCLDDRLLHGRFASAARTQFLLESLADLDASLKKLGGALVVRHGDPAVEIPVLARTTGAAEIHVTGELTPFGRDRARRMDVELTAHPGLTVVEDVTAIATGHGKPYTVFTPFHRRWLEAQRREPLSAPRRISVPTGLDAGTMPTLGELGLDQEVRDPLPGGEGEGRARLERFLRSHVDAYPENHDALAADRTSRLSPYLHFGCLSPREVENRLGTGEAPQAFRRQLCWRDFHHHVLFHNPANRALEMQERYRGTIEWDGDELDFQAWTEGRTGFPLVDAGMRQLRAEGFMHNRARMVVGSFLTKDLGIDWRRGEAWFMRLLLDGDEANNNGNWQWIASVGTDPAPYFQRMLNPTLQMERFDPDGEYVRRYVPELGRVPGEWLREPWLMPSEVQEQAGCRIGIDYPEPIVDRRASREAAKARYRAAG
ncbi:MAG: deoxyribodipyrimidine photo-lyase [Thermoleophilaceae bacterium]|nr:deoxyribodipyrimidine photo-lyase [Thermoleophilaceae bacterium]